MVAVVRCCKLSEWCSSDPVVFSYQGKRLCLDPLETGCSSHLASQYTDRVPLLCFQLNLSEVTLRAARQKKINLLLGFD